MKLLVQAAGIVLAGGALVLAFRLAGRRLAPGARVALAGLALLAGAAAIRLPRTVDDLNDDRRAHARVSRVQADRAGANRYPGLEIDAAFFEWVARRLPSRTSFFVVTQRRHQPSYQWGTFVLVPRLAVERADRAVWLVFYDRDPRAPGAPRFDSRTLMTYRPGFAVARRQDAS